MDMLKTESVETLPPSSSNFWFNLFCLIFFFAVMVSVHFKFPQLETVHLTTLCLLATIIPLWLYDFIHAQVHKRSTTDLLAYPGKVDNNHHRDRMFENPVIKIIFKQQLK